MCRLFPFAFFFVLLQQKLEMIKENESNLCDLCDLKGEREIIEQLKALARLCDELIRLRTKWHWKVFAALKRELISEDGEYLKERIKFTLISESMLIDFLSGICRNSSAHSHSYSALSRKTKRFAVDRCHRKP